jgi:hypothetical protein
VRDLPTAAVDVESESQTGDDRIRVDTDKVTGSLAPDALVAHTDIGCQLPVERP